MFSPMSQVLGGVSFAAFFIGSIVVLPAKEHVFMSVRDIVQIGEKVQPDRTVHGTKDGGSIIADWRVTIVSAGGEAPTCNTIPGPELHQGWSKYDPTARTIPPMHLDVWVGDPGCWERLDPGEYFEFTTWTPRDGSQPVAFSRTFTK